MVRTIKQLKGRTGSRCQKPNVKPRSGQAGDSRKKENLQGKDREPIAGTKRRDNVRAGSWCEEPRGKAATLNKFKSNKMINQK